MTLNPHFRLLVLYSHPCMCRKWERLICTRTCSSRYKVRVPVTAQSYEVRIQPKPVMWERVATWENIPGDARSYPASVMWVGCTDSVATTTLLRWWNAFSTRLKGHEDNDSNYDTSLRVVISAPDKNMKLERSDIAFVLKQYEGEERGEGWAVITYPC